jgi:hypothetical protein
VAIKLASDVHVTLFTLSYTPNPPAVDTSEACAPVLKSRAAAAVIANITDFIALLP